MEIMYSMIVLADYMHVVQWLPTTLVCKHWLQQRIGRLKCERRATKLNQDCNCLVLRLRRWSLDRSWNQKLWSLFCDFGLGLMPGFWNKQQAAKKFFHDQRIPWGLSSGLVLATRFILGITILGVSWQSLQTGTWLGEKPSWFIVQ